MRSHPPARRREDGAMRPAAALCCLILIACGDGTGASPHDAGASLDARPVDARAVDGPGPDAPAGCNGGLHLCERRFDQVAYATTHNAMSNEDDRWILPNQHHGITRQLADGIRGLMLDTHYEEGRAMLCHGECGAGAKPLAEGLAEITAFLRANPREIVSIIFESYVTPADTEAAFRDAGLLPFVHPQPQGAPWPTLRALIDAGHRLVVLTSDGGGAFPWYLDEWAHVWETPYSYKSAAEFTCRLDRGQAENALFVLDHFLTNPVGLPELAEMVNHDPLLGDRARRCQRESGRLPNFVTVDFYDIGDVLEVVRSLNAP